MLVELQQTCHGPSVVQDPFRELLEWALAAVKQIQFSYYPWRDVSSFFITILLILFKTKTSFSWYEITFKKK